MKNKSQFMHSIIILLKLLFIPYLYINLRSKSV